MEDRQLYPMASRAKRREMSRRIDNVIELLRESSVRARVDQPIYKALGGFAPSPESHTSPKLLLETLGRCIQLIYGQAVGAPRELSMNQAQAEAISLLEQSYRSPNGARGYSAALVTIQVHGMQGVMSILEHMVATIISRERQKYFDSVMEKRFACLDWQAKCQVVEVIMERFSHLFDPAIAESPPGRFANSYADLLMVLIEAYDKNDAA